MTTIAERIVGFLAIIKGLDRLHPVAEEPRKAVIDLNTDVVIEADLESPSGETMVYERPNGERVRVYTYKLVEQLFVRHACELSITDGGTVEEPYQHISDHFYARTGFAE